jgi:hypothetical protein
MIGFPWRNRKGNLYDKELDVIVNASKKARHEVQLQSSSRVGENHFTNHEGR